MINDWVIWVYNDDIKGHYYYGKYKTQERMLRALWRLAEKKIKKGYALRIEEFTFRPGDTIWAIYQPAEPGSENWTAKGYRL